MEFQQISLMTLLSFALILFAWGYLRYDLVAALCLVIATIIGVVPFSHAFSGFAHPAVITVAAVFVISKAVEDTGILSIISSRIMLRHKRISLQIALICLIVIILSAFINNIGAVAIMIPVALKIAKTKNIPRGLILMPLAFSSLLGGLLTLIGTPPNIIISNYRQSIEGTPYAFFDFTPVGIMIAIVGFVFIVFLGWKLIPLAKKQKSKKYHEKFTAEVIVNKHSKFINKKIAQILHSYEEKAELIALIRDETVYRENLNYFTIQANDSLILETDKWSLRDMMSEFDLSIAIKQQKNVESDHYLTEVTLLPQSSLCRHKVGELQLESLYGFETIAVSRGDETLTERLKDITLKPGDVLLIKSDNVIQAEQIAQIGAVIIEETHIRQFSLRNTVKVLGLFACALLLVITNLVSVDVAFFATAIFMLLTRSINLDTAYRSLNLPIIILIATLIPVGQAIETTGTAAIIAGGIHAVSQQLPISMSVFILILTSTLLSNLVNNAAVALIFAPVALQMAQLWNASLDPFLMAVAIGASCTFLTPIGHQSNALVFSAGNYRFSDFWLLGLPLTVLISIVATVFIPIIWPF